MCQQVTMIGSHRLGPKIGQGSQGEVYAAYDTRTGRTVALKLLYSRQRSASEIRASARVDHPNIVPIYEAGEHEGMPYFTMKLLANSLADEWHWRWYFIDPRAAARLVEMIARAVHHLHQQFYMHRDLKPANILLDEAGTPYVGDFGVATRIDDTQATIAGTRRYMAPEQLDGPPTVQGDIYSLGVVLYELLTFQQPFAGEHTAELVREIKERPPRDPCELRPALHPDLARLCMRCLAKDPAERPASALALAEALRRYLQGDLPEDAPWRRRVWRWCVRHMALAGLLVAVLTFIAVMIPTTVSLVHQHEATKQARLGVSNMNSAAMVAGTVQAHLDVMSNDVTQSARDAELVAALRAGDTAGLLGACARFYETYDITRGRDKSVNSPFDAWFVLDAQGVLRAQEGRERVIVTSRNYEWRDYFQGALALGRRGEPPGQAYVSKVFKSENDQRHKFALSAPIFDQGRLIGVLVAAVATSAKLGSLSIESPDSLITLAGPRDHERHHVPAATHVLFLHQRHRYGDADPIESAEVEQLEAASRGRLRVEAPLDLPPPDLMMASDDYYDPVVRRRALAGFAPVGNTGYVVIVSSLYDDVLRLEAELGWKLAAWASLAVAAGLCVIVLAQRSRQSAW